MAYSRADLLEYERMFNLWCDAQKASHTAALSILLDEIDGKTISNERRVQAAKLAVEARRLMMETLRASPPGTRF